MSRQSIIKYKMSTFANEVLDKASFFIRDQKGNLLHVVEVHRRRNDEKRGTDVRRV
jgi:hypothetical protein